MSEEELFNEALRRNPADRAAYLDAACSGRPELRAAVEGLLRANVGASGFMSGPAPALLATADEPAAVERPGRVIGPYKLVEPIGEGGMGTVWMAQQTEPVRRLVALKLIKAGMDTAQVVARFETERQALALMDHPNIARVLDGGTTDAGRPYFVMDLVKGVPITRYCDEHRLTPRQRLELFIPVCQAVQHAHQKGIIHRDLKPSNVLVALYDGKPVPKVIDFGVAKAAGQALTDKTLVTGFGAIVGTLEYMSPEQAEVNQLDIDTRSDIYSLGVLLYELLAGSTPFTKKDLEKAGMLEMLRVIREDEPSKPSTKLSSSDALPTLSANRGTEPVKLTRLMRGELDWIVMKALEKDRGRRYETANAFAADVQRYLADEAVQACPPSARYRFRKFVRRNKGPVLAGGLVALTLVGGIVGTSLGLIAAYRQREAAAAAAKAEGKAKEATEAREAETRAILEFVESKVFAAARPGGQDGGLGRDISLRQAMEAALPSVENGFSDQPLVEARLRMALGWSFWCLGEPRRAADQFQAARTLYTRHLGPYHPDTLRSMNGLANSYVDLGRDAEALKLHEETLALRKAELGPDDPDTLMSMHNLAFSYIIFGRFTEALKLHEETLALRTTKLGPDHPHTLLSMNGLAFCYFFLGRHTEALELRKKTLALSTAKLGPYHPQTLRTMQVMGDSYAKLGEQTEALELRTKALALYKVHLGLENRFTLMSMAGLASSYADLGRDAEALKLLEETLALQRTRLGPDHRDTLFTMKDLANVLIKLGRGAEAVPIIDQFVTLAAGKAGMPRLFKYVMQLRLRHFEKTKDAVGCRATAEMWERLNRTDAGSLYDGACYRAVTAAVVKIDPKTPGADVTRLATEEAGRAMALLCKAVAAGYTDAEHMKQDKDLDALREREDFKKVLAELEAKKK